MRLIFKLDGEWRGGKKEKKENQIKFPLITLKTDNRKHYTRNVTKDRKEQIGFPSIMYCVHVINTALGSK